MKSASPALVLVPLALAALCAAAEESKDPGKPAHPFAGIFESAKDKGQILQIEADRFIISVKGQIVVGRILGAEPDGLTVRLNGLRMSLKLELDGADLKTRLAHPSMRSPAEIRVFRRLDPPPPPIELKPLKFGDAGEVPAEKSKEIQDELGARVKEDQAVRVDPKRRADWARVDRENTAWLRKTAAETGWIDTARFGSAAANAAFLIVQHSGDLPLMMAALPEIEKDLKSAKGDAQGYALLYDRLRIMLGEKQRFGSQVAADPKGRPAVLPLEDRAKVDEFRKELGLMPLGEYLGIMKKMNGIEVGIMDEEEERKPEGEGGAGKAGDGGEGE